MSDAYVGEIRLFAGNYAPEGWNICDGSLKNIQTYPALYSLIGVTYGGNGTTSFALPDLRGRVPVGQGQGANLSTRVIGQKGGASAVAVAQSQMPLHNHAFSASSKNATTPTLANNVGLAATNSAGAAGQVAAYAPNNLVTTAEQVALANNAISVAPGGGQSHNNLMPYLAINYIISMAGLYPDFS